MNQDDRIALVYSFLEYSSMSGKGGPKDILRPIIVKSINTLGKANFTEDEIRDAIERDFGKKLDRLLLRSELGRLQQSGLLSYDQKSRHFIAQVTTEDYTNQYIAARDSTDMLIRSMKQFLDTSTDQYKSVSYGGVLKYLISHIEGHFAEIASIVTNRDIAGERNSEKSGIHQFIDQYIHSVILPSPELFKAFESIFNGIVLLFVYQKSPEFFSKENPFGTKKFFLDTNIVLRLLGLQDEVTNAVGAEFKKYMAVPGFSCAVTKDTWLELVGLFNGYSNCHYLLQVGGKVGHVYQAMKNRNVDADDIGAFLDQIRSELNDAGITIEKYVVIEAADLHEYENQVKKLAVAKLQHRKDLDLRYSSRAADDDDRFVKQAQHDLKNLYNISYLRKGRQCHTFEEETFYFVTADYTSRKFGRDNLDFTGQSYSLSDSTLAFLLHYRNPENSKGFTALSFINAHFNSKNLSLKNWADYYDVVHERKSSGDLTTKQASFLLNRVILSNDKFEHATPSDLVENSLAEFEQLMKEHEELKAAKIVAEGERDALAGEVSKVRGELGQLKAAINRVSGETEGVKQENRTLKEDLFETRGLLKRTMNRTVLLALALLAIGMALFLTNNLLFGTITTVISGLFFFVDMLRRFFERNKKH